MPTGDSTILLLPPASTITGSESLPIVQGGVTKVETLNVLLASTEKLANKGIANGYPSLDSSGLVPASQLPSYIDDVLEGTWISSIVFNSLLPITGPLPYVPLIGVIYVDTTTNLTYRWSGSVYVKINDGSVTSFNSRVGAVLPMAGDYTKADVGLSNVDNTSDAAKPVSTAQASAIATKEPAIAIATLQEFWRGDKTWQSIKAAVYGALMNVIGGYVKAAGVVGNGDSLMDIIKKLDGNIDLRQTFQTLSITSSATPAINTGTFNLTNVSITALATAITSMTSSLTGTPSNFDKLLIRIKDNGTIQTIAWGTSFSGALLPTTTVISTPILIGFIYDSVLSKWVCVAVN